MADAMLKIGVLVGGISGITASWLLSRRHPVTLIEREPRPGGQTNRIQYGPDAGTAAIEALRQA